MEELQIYSPDSSSDRLLQLGAQTEISPLFSEKICHRHEVGSLLQLGVEIEIYLPLSEKCCHQHEAAVVMTAHTPDNLLQVGAIVNEDLV